METGAQDPLRNRQAPAEMSPDEFRAAGHELVDRIADFLGSLPERPVTATDSPADVRKLIEGTLPKDGTDASALLNEATSLMFNQSLFNGHPRFWGYITSSAAPIGTLGDLLASAVNPNLGSWRLSPIATEIEAQTVRWIAELLGFPTDCGGLLVSGGNMANFVGYLAARAAKAGYDIRKDGADPKHKLRVYVSAETHTWIHNAADLFGLGLDSVRWIPTDDALRMDVGRLKQQIAADKLAGDQPIMVVGAAGTVSTGVVDPLRAIAEVAKENDLWFHIDGAYGGFAACVPDSNPDFAAIANADSIAVDPHKWLYAPLEAGCALVRKPEHLLGAFSYRPNYYMLEDEVYNYFEWGPQNSRGFRALKVWLALRHVGRSGYEQMISDDIQLAAECYRMAAEHPELEALSHHLSITTFRYVPPELHDTIGTMDTEVYLNKLNEQLVDAIQTGGEIFVTNAIMNDTYALRMCIVNFRTSLEDIEAIPEIVVELGRKVHQELQGAPGG